MKRLDRAVQQSSNLAPSLPNMYESLAARQVAIRRGEVTLIAGQPGAGKSTLAMALANRAQVPVLYFSADTHAHTQSMRLIAMLTDTDQAIVEQAMLDTAWAAEVLGQAGHIRWSFDSAPSVEAVESELDAHVELFSRAPEMVVIDNLTDMTGSNGDEWAGMRDLLKDFKYLAREYDCAFLVLHHTTEGVAGNPCPPRSALMGKVAQTPALILTVAQDEAGFLGVCPVKSRYGPSSPSGSEPTWLRYLPASMQVLEVDQEFNRAALGQWAEQSGVDF